jgi:O-antigen ligase
MDSSAQAVPRLGFLSEAVASQHASSQWRRIFILLHCALFIPYITDAIPTLYGQEIFPIRPAVFMLVLCALNAFCILSKGIDCTKTSLLLILFLSFRAFDIGILQRFLYPDGQMEALFSTLALTLTAAIIAISMGVTRKTFSLPILFVSGISILVQVSSVLLEFAGYIQMSTVPGRAAGFACDSNDSCMMMNLMLGVFLTLNRRFWLNLGMIAITAVGVLPTLSRGGLLILALIAALFCLLNLRKHATKLLLAAAAFVPIAGIMIGLLVSSTNTGGVVDQNAKKRIEAMFGGNVESMQSDERLKDLTDGLNAAIAHPLTGLGTGAGTLLYQPHNQLVTLWIELGLLGPILFLAMLASAACKVIQTRGKGIYILIPLIMYIPLAQTLLDKYAYLYSALTLFYYTSSRFFAFRITRHLSVN